MKGTRVPSGRSAIASYSPWLGVPRRSASAMGHSSCAIGVPSGWNSFQLTHQESLPITGSRPEKAMAALL